MIRLKSDEEVEKIRRCGRIVAEVLQELAETVAPGITTVELDKLAEELLGKKGVEPAFKGYGGYPNTSCTSVNEQIVHGIPSTYQLKEGDIISLDLGGKLEGYYSDAAITLPVGGIDVETSKLVQVTQQALMAGINQARVGRRLSNISHAVQKKVEEHGFSIIRSFVGHGIGKRLQEEPQVPNFGLPGRGIKLKRGMVLAIEPMASAGQPEATILSDGWTAVTKDGSRAAHFEHTVVITNGEPDILTR